MPVLMRGCDVAMRVTMWSTELVSHTSHCHTTHCAQVFPFSPLLSCGAIDDD